ncbi:MAG: AbrB/MazE/SpoVT family DNA-binding domain-containing protein [Thaumarchaeota archaeon]|nr:AbrB/MazE/SpoVT family DNA-binding domain-containing protein [Nitrososphaerota archaeon]
MPVLLVGNPKGDLRVYLFETLNYTCIISDTGITLIKSKVRKWGNSFGVIIPKDLADKENLKEGEDVEISIRRVSDIRALRGKFRIKDLQRAKDEMRKGWSD